MGVKLGRKAWPAGSGPDDFECFGPPATKDAEFSACMIADMGCFKQGEVDSNKYYHGAVVKHKKTGNWYVYFEWGRVGGTTDFLFVDCASDKADAQKEFEKQLLSKNLKRGKWETIAGIATLMPKSDKEDLYRVRALSTRSTGLPDAKRITSNDGAKKSTPIVAAKAGSAPAKPKADKQTMELMRALNVATVSYTKGAMSDSSIPTQTSIDEARQILTEAQKQIVKVGDDLDDQVADKDLVSFSSILYSRIPKKKAIGAPASEWILSKDNIFKWQSDLDAFEAALYSTTNAATVEADPFDGMSLDMGWVDPKSSLGTWLYRWPTNATRRKHGYGDMRVHNAWTVARHGDEASLQKCQDGIAASYGKHWVREQPLHQKDVRVSPERKDAFEKSNSSFMFHGTRSVNVSGILRKSLLLPKQLVGVVITGAMFGPGLYFADDWMKSAGYTSLRGSYWSGGAGAVTGRHAFMFIVEVACGNPFVAPGPKGYTEPPKGHHCVFGKAGHSQVQNNEWIVFQKEQHMLRYLIEFDC